MESQREMLAQCCQGKHRPSVGGSVLLCRQGPRSGFTAQQYFAYATVLSTAEWHYCSVVTEGPQALCWHRSPVGSAGRPWLQRACGKGHSGTRLGSVLVMTDFETCVFIRTI